ncbi:MAG: hypothetical protein CMJ27_03390 [Phycisphaerae bacterium]|nr:hypothetical protein [Phycisphaerae bacterium]OUX02683.1 MAG: hypothetical protein CBD91_02075 [Phycisphaeraceae bacterium TMED231]
MPSSVQTIESSGIASNRGETRFPEIRAAAVLAAIGSMTLAAAGQDSYDGALGGDSNFDTPASWGGVYPGDDFGGNTIDILSIFGTDPINVANDITGIGGLTNTFDGDVVFGGVGSFRFNDASTINPGDGSFTFEIDVIADGSLTFDLTGDGLVQIDGAFTTTNGGTILAEGGFVDVNGETTSGEGTVWNANDGGFNFNGVFNATGAQTFAGLSGNVADDVFTFNDANFLNGVDPLTDIATFDAATVNFNGVTTVAAGYGFDLNNAAVVTFNDFIAEGDHAINFLDADSTFTVGGDASFVDAATLTVSGEGEAGFGGEVTLGRNFTANVVDADSKVTFRGTTIFESDANLTVQGLGTFELGGSTELPGPFTLLVNDGATANWLATTTLDGDFTINTTGGAGNANVNFGTDGVSTAGGFANAAGEDDLTIDITTDGTDDTVKFAGPFLRDFTGTINVNDDSAVTFEGGGAGGLGTTSLQLGANTSVTLDSGTAGGTMAFDQLIGSDNVGAIVATGNDDITLSVRGGGSIDDPETGLYMGAITDNTAAGNAGKLSFTVTDGIFNYGGVASYTGNTTVSGGGTFRIDGDGLTTGVVTDTDSLLVTGGTVLLETSARLLGEGEVGLASGSTIDITADATNGANLQFDNAGSIDGTVTLSGDRLGAYNLIFGNSAVDDSAIRGSLTASGNSGAFFAGDLTVAGGGQMLLEETAIAQVDGTMSVGGLVDLSGTSADGLTVLDGLDMTDGGQIQLAGSRTLSVTGDSTMAADTGLLLDGESTATFTGNLDNAGTISVNNEATFEVNNGGSVTGDGILTLSGTALALIGGDAAFSIIQAENESVVDVTGNLALTRTSSFEAGTSLSVGDILTIGDGTDPMSLIFSGNGVEQTDVTAANGINLQAGSTLFANANIDTAAINYAGDIFVGVVGDNRGVLNLNTGDLDSDSSDATLNINLTGDYVNELDAGTFGQNSVINVAAGMSDFADGGDVFVEVQDFAYIPDDKDILLLNSPGGITGGTSVTTNQDGSITRTWDINPDNGGGFDPLTQLWARSSADYASPLQGTPEYLRGVELNSLRPEANLDPTGHSGVLLGALDAIDTLEAYEAAIDGVGPTTQVSTIQLAANTQYFTVLRKEIQRRYDIVEQRTPAPFRLWNGTEYTSSDDQAVQSSIRRMTPESTTAEGFGVFWGRNLDTPSEGDIIGISGNEYGGLGGFAWQFGNGFLGGINMGYSQITGDLDRGFGNTRVSTVRGGGFLAWSNGEGLFFDAALAGGWNNYKFTRVIPGTQISADSDASGFQMDLTMGGGYRFELSEGWALTPEASFMYSYVNTGDINEDTSSSAALNISPGDLSSVIGRVGGGLSWSALPGLVLDGELGWQGNFNFNGNYGVSLANQGTSLSFEIDDQAVNTAYYGGGIVWTPTYNVNVSLQYEGRSGEGFSSNMIFGGVSIGF